jgi:2-octaprenylphenol hydroxylase
MQKFDVLIVGGGMVGLTLALALRQQSQLSIAIADTGELTPVTEQADVRVSAINEASKNIFANLGVWPLIVGHRAQAYQHMHIWDHAGYGKLDFDSKDLSSKQPLGWIIENSVIRQALWQKAEQDSGITFFTEQPLTNLGVGMSEVFASFATQMPITAKLVVGADGANSWVRQQMAMPIAFRDYDHHALVATVSCAQGHNSTAWQVFLDNGPLALLPLYQPNLCSIVWSTSPQQAQRLMALDPAQFAKELTAASDGKLGQIELVSKRFSFPLTMRLAHDFIKQSVVLIGDAAHTIHPLAGQGVNLGLLDAAALAQTLTSEQDAMSAQSGTIKWLDSKALRAFGRWRKSQATEMVVAMEGIKQVFTPQQGAVKLLRGLGMSLLDNLGPAKKLLIKQALGDKEHLPELAKAQPTKTSLLTD